VGDKIATAQKGASLEESAVSTPLSIQIDIITADLKRLTANFNLPASSSNVSKPNRQCAQNTINEADCRKWLVVGKRRVDWGNQAGDWDMASL
jgi:hypothetical protein